MNRKKPVPNIAQRPCPAKARHIADAKRLSLKEKTKKRDPRRRKMKEETN